MKNNYLFTSESVTEGHPDKMCDIISDAVLDAYLEHDKDARVACEVATTTGIVSVMGEISSNKKVDINDIVRQSVKEIGYDSKFGFDSETCAISVLLDKQSGDIDMGVSNSQEIKNTACGECRSCGIQDDYLDHTGAGDQGMMFGFACDETATLMPAPIYYAHKLCEKLSEVRKNRELEYLGPDGKSMVTFNYVDGKPFEISAVVISTQHVDGIPQGRIREDITDKVIRRILPEKLMSNNIKIFINPTGRFVKGGPCADTGLTGRKIIVDTYGGMGRHGGGAFSGKDPTKVDRTGAYAARYVAKNIVASGIAKKCEVQIAYAIGVANPVSVYVNTFGTSKINNDDIGHMIKLLFDLRPTSLIEYFNLKQPIYKKLAAYGHMGREDLGVLWEECNKTTEIKEYFNI